MIATPVVAEIVADDNVNAGAAGFTVMAKVCVAVFAALVAVIVYVPLTALYVNLRTAGVRMPRLDPPDVLMTPALLVAIGIALAHRRYQPGPPESGCPGWIRRMC